MGNQNGNFQGQNSQLGKQLQENTLKSPSEAFALKQKEKSIDKIDRFKQLIKKVNFVKKESGFKGVSQIVIDCPIYHLKELDCYYQGQWQKCRPHGCGIAVYHNLSYYQGDFVQAELDSKQGFFFFNNNKHWTPPKNKQSVLKQSQKEIRMQSAINQSQSDLEILQNKSTYYIGEFVKSKFQGEGKIFHQEIFYQGGWKNGKRSGKGSQWSSLKNYKFDGLFENGFKEGKGRYVITDDGHEYIYQGQFSKGRFHGHGVIKVDDYIYYEGGFARGLKQGKGKITLHEGVYEGQFIKDKAQGLGQIRFLNQDDPEEGTYNQSVVSWQQHLSQIEEKAQMLKTKIDTFKKQQVKNLKIIRIREGQVIRIAGIYEDFPLLLVEDY